MGLTVLDPARVSGGYVHIRYANPSTPLSAGFVDEGGYILAFVNNAAYDNQRILQWFWAGVRYLRHRPNHRRAIPVLTSALNWSRASDATATASPMLAGPA
jgi:hypothetical protein